MPQHHKIDVSEGIDVNKTNVSKECELCHYCFFKDIGFKFEEHASNGCHNLLAMGFPLKDIAVLSAKLTNFRCILMASSKNEVLEKLNNSVPRDRGIL